MLQDEGACELSLGSSNPSPTCVCPTEICVDNEGWSVFTAALLLIASN